MLQWIIDQVHWVGALLGGGGFGAIASVVSLRTVGKKREVAALERETAREQRMSALEARLDERDAAIAALHEANVACERRGEECESRTTLLEKRIAERDDAIEELQQQIMRGGRVIRHRITPREFPALDGVDKDRWDE